MTIVQYCLSHHAGHFSIECRRVVLVFAATFSRKGYAGPPSIAGHMRPCRVLGSRRDFRLVPRRGCRGRCSVRRNISVRCARCDASTAVVTVTGLCSSCSVYQHLSTRRTHHVTYSMLNVRSLTHKTDDVLEFIRDNSVDVMCLTESCTTRMMSVSAD